MFLLRSRMNKSRVMEIFRQTRTQIFIECTLYSSLPPDIILRNTKIPIIVRWNLKSSDISRLIWCCWWVSPHLHTPSPANPLYTGVGGGESFPWHKSYVILQLTLFIWMSVTLSDWRYTRVMNSSGRGKMTEKFGDVICSNRILTNGTSDNLIYLTAACNIFFSVTALLGNMVILMALRKETSLHPPTRLLLRNLATTDLLVGLFLEPLDVVYLLSVIHQDWYLCRVAETTTFIVGYTLGPVSLWTATAISFDRLLALKLAIRHSEVVTIKKTYAVITTFWVMSIVLSSSYVVESLVSFWYSHLTVASCLAISIPSYAVIFRWLRRQQTRVIHGNSRQQQRDEITMLRIARYRKTVSNILWVKLSLIMCYSPYGVASVLFFSSPSSSLFLPWQMTMSVVFVNSTLNPFLYCWKIREVRKAVKSTFKQSLCWSST